ncbi:hypothetical protein FISHEDRAFT_63270 [Fistulina hepatica ATCC 64428]|uniref:Aspergillopepsin n=1 Tax=Fistulina hepatica ATCC 64428 TaxID=1128425 RepID=A0A0D7ASE3_9AGAR|nr:hypothetical protein FISHEDRAFT_63270 [Fistulina hepatica ATCC 64428]
MRYILALLTFITTALATSHGRGLAGRIARRQAGRHLSRPVNRVETLTNETDVEYTSNWAGAVLVADSATYTAVTGTFTVPTPSVPDDASSSNGSYSASAWVGIDGDTCSNAILQAGLDFTIDADLGNVSYDGWYEWYPDYSYDFDISFSAGDVVTVTVTATSTTSGTAVIENTTTGQTVSTSITSSYALCEQNAEWIVEDYEEGNSPVAFADFGVVTFTDAEATMSSGTVGPENATIFDIEQDTVLTSVSISSDSINITYI